MRTVFTILITHINCTLSLPAGVFQRILVFAILMQFLVFVVFILAQWKPLTPSHAHTMGEGGEEAPTAIS